MCWRNVAWSAASDGKRKEKFISTKEKINKAKNVNAPQIELNIRPAREILLHSDSTRSDQRALLFEAIFVLYSVN